MDVFGKGTDEPSRPLLPPGICWVCDNSPQQEGMKVIDTRRNTRAGGALSHTSVRKYICEPCAQELGAAVGMIAPEAFEDVKVALKNEIDRNARLDAALAAAESGQVKVIPARDVQELLDHVKAELDKVRVPASDK